MIHRWAEGVDGQLPKEDSVGRLAPGASGKRRWKPLARTQGGGGWLRGSLASGLLRGRGLGLGLPT